MGGADVRQDGEAGLEVTELRKSYGGVPVLRGVDLSVRGGEIHALLGANGAGKSTLIKCISGAEHPDSGQVAIAGDPVSFASPKAAGRAGIAVIHQVPSVALSLDVSENVYLGIEPRFGPVRRRAVARAGTQEVLTSLGSAMRPDGDLRGVGNADLQVIEIAKALVRDPRVLILDEPTAALTEREVEQLAGQMRRLRDRGLPLLLVTHRLGEALELADRVTVLRGGEVVLSARTSEVSRDDLVDAIVGRHLDGPTPQRAEPVGPKRPSVLQVDALTGAGLGPVSLSVQAGEVVGVFGLVGAGRTELLETVAGARRSDSGTMTLAGEPLSPRSPVQAVARGIALVPSDRLRKSIFGSLPAESNVLVSRLSALARGGLLRDRGQERSVFSSTAELLQLHPRRGDLEARRFSGGNQQKLVIGRWLNERSTCRLLLLDEPTDGVDVGARDDLYRAVKRFVSDDERGVLFASSEPEELLRVADRVVVLSRGRVAGVLQHHELSERRLLELAHAGESLSTQS